MRASLQEALQNDSRLVGTVLTIPGASAAEFLAEPFDVVWVDLEHAAIGPLEAQDMILGAQAAGTHALVRLPAEAHGLLGPMLDAGADGVVLANVTDPAQAVAAADRVVHPPAGTRGWGPRRLSLRGRSAEPRQGDPAVWIQIETAAGVAHAADIARVRGVDAIVVGTSDLSLSLGVALDLNAPDLLRAIASVEIAARAAGVAFGLAGALDNADASVLARAPILVHSTDARLSADAVDKAAAWLRAVSDQQPVST